MKIGIVILAHDGLQSICTGVGVVVNSVVESFPKIIGKINIRNKVNLICLSPYLEKKSEDYDPEITAITKKNCTNSGGFFEQIKTLYGGKTQSSNWGNYYQWKYSSKVFSKKIKEISKKYDKLIVLSNDTIFASVGRYLKNKKNIIFIWIPHSLGTLFKNEDSNKKRISLEKKAVRNINTSDNQFIGYIGETIKKELIMSYSSKNDKLIPLINGIYSESIRYMFNKKNQSFLANNIPKNKKLILSFGRAVVQKGYDILIPAMKTFLEKNQNYHLVLLMPEETSNNEYLNQIYEQLYEIPKDRYTQIKKFDKKLPYNLLKYQLLDSIIFPSRFEGNSITLLESFYFSNKSVKIFCSDIPQFKEQLQNLDITSFFELNSNNLYKILNRYKNKCICRRKCNIQLIVDTYSNLLSNFII